MVISKKIHNGWILKSHGVPYKQIADGTGLGIATVQRAISTGVCSPSTMDKINDFLIHGISVETGKQSNK